MPKFSYKLMTSNSQRVEGTIKALSQKSAWSKVAKDGHAVLRMSKVQKDSLLNKDLFPSFGFSKSEQINFYRNMSMMMSSGISVVDILSALKLQIKNKSVVEAIGEMEQNVKNGKKLSESMAMFPKYFPWHITSMIKVGEEAGRLVDVLERLAVSLEKNYELRRKVVGAMFYPLIVVLAMIVVGVVLMVYVLPHIAAIFEDVGEELPFITKILLDAASFLTAHPILISLSLATLIGGFVAFYRNRSGRKIVHALILKSPIFGKLALEYNLTVFFRSMESLFDSGVSLEKSVDIAKGTIKNLVVIDVLDKIRPALLHGVRLGEAVSDYPDIFPQQIQQVIKVGEDTGGLGNSFTRITKHYERMVDYKASNLTTILEPLLIIIIGVFIGGVAISVFLPIYGIAVAI